MEQNTTSPKFRSNRRDIWVVSMISGVFMIIVIALGVAGSASRAPESEREKQAVPTIELDMVQNPATPTLIPRFDPTETPVPTQQAIGALKEETLTGSGSAVLVLAMGEEIYEGRRSDFWFQFSTEGGPVTGKVEGVCTGTVGGTFTAGSSRIEGTLSGVCSIDGEQRQASGTYTGVMELKRGRGNGTYVGMSQDDSLEGDWNVVFEPVP